MKETVGLPAAFARGGVRSGSLPAGQSSAQPRRLIAASRGPSWPPCSGSRLCARGSAEQQPQCLFAGAPRCGPGVFGTTAQGSRGKAALPGPPPHPQPGGPPGPPAGFICGFVGRRAGGVRRTHNGRPGNQAARPYSAVRAGRNRNASTCAAAAGPAARHGGSVSGAIRTGQPCRHCRAHSPQHRKTPCEGGALFGCVGAVEPLKPGVPTVPQPQHSRIHPGELKALSGLWPNGHSIVRFMAQW